MGCGGGCGCPECSGEVGRDAPGVQALEWGLATAAAKPGLSNFWALGTAAQAYEDALEGGAADHPRLTAFVREQRRLASAPGSHADTRYDGVLSTFEGRHLTVRTINPPSLSPQRKPQGGPAPPPRPFGMPLWLYCYYFPTAAECDDDDDGGGGSGEPGGDGGLPWWAARRRGAKAGVLTGPAKGCCPISIKTRLKGPYCPDVAGREPPKNLRVPAAAPGESAVVWDWEVFFKALQNGLTDQDDDAHKDPLGVCHCMCCYYRQYVSVISEVYVDDILVHDFGSHTLASYARGRNAYHWRVLQEQRWPYFFPYSARPYDTWLYPVRAPMHPRVKDGKRLGPEPHTRGGVPVDPTVFWFYEDVDFWTVAGGTQSPMDLLAGWAPGQLMDVGLPETNAIVSRLNVAKGYGREEWEWFGGNEPHDRRCRYVFKDMPLFGIKQGSKRRVELDFVEVIGSYGGNSPYTDAANLMCGTVSNFFGAEGSDEAAVWCHARFTITWPKGKESPNDFDEAAMELGCYQDFLISQSKIIRR